MKLKEFVLFRHAEKNNDYKDPELTRWGHQQGELIFNHIQTLKLPKPDILLSSPKKRAQQTLMPTHLNLGAQLIIDPLLDERNHPETGLQFESRVKFFLFTELPSKQSTCVFACTHHDWIDSFSYLAPLDTDLSKEIYSLPTASYFHFQISDDTSLPWKLINKGSIK